MPKTTVMKRPSCYSEYDTLQQVLLCPPQYMKIREVINHTQQHFIKENIDTTLAIEQHNTLIQTLKKNNVEVFTLPTQKNYPEQVFTRDIGFTIGNTLYIGVMKIKIRQGEEIILKKWLDEQQIFFYPLTKGSIEGGDVLVDHEYVWIGESARTSTEAIAELRDLLTDFQVISIPFAPEYLHLDCVFNLISANEALIFPPAFQPADVEFIASRYELIEISAEEQFTLGTNILSLGNKKIISLPMNQGVNKQLRQRGYSVIEVDITEIIKSGGSFRCITFPLVRDR